MIRNRAVVGGQTVETIIRIIAGHLKPVGHNFDYCFVSTIADLDWIIGQGQAAPVVTGMFLRIDAAKGGQDQHRLGGEPHRNGPGLRTIAGLGPKGEFGQVGGHICGEGRDGG